MYIFTNTLKVILTERAWETQLFILITNEKFYLLEIFLKKRKKTDNITNNFPRNYWLLTHFSCRAEFWINKFFDLLPEMLQFYQYFLKAITIQNLSDIYHIISFSMKQHLPLLLITLNAGVFLNNLRSIGNQWHRKE